MQHLGEHPNVVNLIGSCTLDGSLNLILEYCTNGSLLMFLRSRKDDFVKTWDGEEANDIGFTVLTTIAMQASDGMAFLESKKVSSLNSNHNNIKLAVPKNLDSINNFYSF